MYEICYTEPDNGTIYELVTTEEINEDFCPAPYYKWSPESVNLEYDFTTSQSFQDEPGRESEFYDVFSGEENRFPYCNTKERNINTITQNTKTLEVNFDSRVESLIVPEYLKGNDNQTIRCVYQYYDSTDGNRRMWEVTPTTATLYNGNVHFLSSKNDILFDLGVEYGASYWGRGKLMESKNGNNYYAACSWLGW